MTNPTQGHRPVHSQVREVILHVPKYQFRGSSRLARDAGISRSTVNRLMRGAHLPTFSTAAKIASAIERALGKPVDPRDLVREGDAAFPRTPCEICGCRGCYPPSAFDADDRLVEAFRGVAPGRWTAEHVKAARGAK